MKWKVGDTTITKLEEIVYPEFPDVIPAATPDVVKKVKWLFPHFVTPEGVLSLSVHSLIVETPGATLIVDTCIGNDRDRDPFEVMHMLSTSYMEDMVAAGYHPDGVDYVLCTHLHLDHVGWNTKLVDGAWVPTFPNAAYLMSKQDLEFWSSIDANAQDDFMQLQRKVFDDSLQPVLDAGLAKPVEGAAEVCEGVSLVPTPGHTPGHVSVQIESAGETALITGDFIHHPIQFNDPNLVSPFDVDNDAAVATRHRVFGEYADSPTLIIGTHFAGPTAGKLVRDGDTYRLDV
uniref:Zn-dependent hydrolases, including glyoxylases n=1 Tax=uncultured Chromatiales bacterium HF0200_41F04 TaxID=710740 RepID=E0XV16_9GAMM|nr:Zn-dependent hydrolases, including glyoxylases [uncultured Chromatiales bacterium HF0200_41F04]